MKRRYRIRSRTDFQRIYTQGKSVVNRALVLYVLAGDPDEVRIGIAAGKKLGKAVVRNRLRRLIREAVRTRLGQIRRGWRLVFIARTGAVELGYPQMEARVEDLLRRSGIWIDNPSRLKGS